MSRLPDARDIEESGTLQVRHRAARGRNLSLFHDLLLPASVRPPVQIDAVRLAAKSQQRFHRDRRHRDLPSRHCGRRELYVDDLSPPLTALVLVNHHFVPVPRLNRGQISFFAQPTHAYVARSALRPCKRTPFRDLRPRPFAAFPEAIKMNSEKAADQNCFASVVIPVGHEDPMHHALFRVADRLRFHSPWLVIHKRHMSPVLWRLRISAYKWGVDQYLIPAPVNIHPA